MTGETSWTDPRQSASAGTDAAAAATPAAGAAADWVEGFDEASQRAYYYNNKTGATQWEKPAELEAAAKKPTEAAAADTASAPAPAPAAAEPAAATPAAAAEPAVTHTPGVLSDKSKELWKKVLQHTKEKATAKIQARNNKFGRLRHFGRLKKKKEAAPPAAAAASAPSAGAGAGAGAGTAAAAAPAAAPVEDDSTPVDPTVVASMLKVDIPDTVDEMSLEEYAEAYFNLNRKGLFNKRTTVAKILNWKSVRVRWVWSMMALRVHNGFVVVCSGCDQDITAVDVQGFGRCCCAITPQHHGVHGRPQHKEGRRWPRVQVVDQHAWRL